MPRLNLHIYGNTITHESRIMKETETISRLGIVDKIFIVGLWAEGLLEEEPLDDTRTILRFKLISRKLGEGTVPKSFKLAEWMARIAVKFSTKKVAMVNIHYLAGLPIGLFFKVFKRTKLVYDTHELETERNGWSAGRRRLARILEKALIRTVDKTIVSSPLYADWYEKTYGTRPATVLNAPKNRPVTHQDIFRKTFNIPPDTIIFLYQGGLSTGRSIEEILEAFAATEETNKAIVFMGYGPLTEAVQTAAEQSERVFFHPAVNPDVLLDYTAGADIGFCLIQNTSLSYRYTLPNKMLEYAMAELPVVVGNFGEMKRLAEAYQIGYVVRDETATGIADVIRQVNREELASFKDNLIKFKEVFNWENQEETLASVYRELSVRPN